MTRERVTRVLKMREAVVAESIKKEYVVRKLMVKLRKVSESMGEVRVLMVMTICWR